MDYRRTACALALVLACFAGRAQAGESADPLRQSDPPRRSASEAGSAAKELVKTLVDGEKADREGAEKQLRELKAAAIPALRAAKPEKDEALVRTRNLLTDIAVETAKVDPVDAEMVHQLGREEGQGKRYANAVKLYERAQKLYDHLREDANDRKDKAQAKTYRDKRELCDRMKDKADHKLKGETGTGLNLGFVRIGVSHDVSDDWE